MKIVCISDTHNHHHVLDGNLPDGDMIIHAGDVAIHGSVAEIQEFVDWFSALPHQYKIFVGGNHDGALEHSRELITIPENVIYLENQLVECADLKIWGSPVSPPYRSMGFMWDDARRAELYPQIPKDCDIVINHSPAYGALDQILEGQNVGCQFLAERLAQINPRLVISGHIHEAYGVMQKDSTTYVNASTMTRRYQPHNPALVVEI